MRGPLLLALVCTWVSTAAAAVTLAATPSTELPLAARFAPELKRRSSKALIKFAEAAIGRFLLDEQEFAVDTTTDIADLIVAATSLEILLTRKDQPAQVAVLATRAASVLHRLGWVYDNDRGLRGRMATLVKKAKGKAAKTSSTQMRDSMARLFSVGKTWFPSVCKLALKVAPDDPQVHNLNGLYLKQEGRLAAAAEAFEKALKLQARPVYALNLYEVALARGSSGVASLRKGLLQRLPAVAGALRRLDEELVDRRATKAFERAGGKPTGTVLLDQAERYLRLGAVGRGDALVREAMQNPSTTSRKVAKRAALYWMQSRRDARALAVIEARNDRGDPFWRPLKLTLAVRTKLDALVGQLQGVTPEVEKAWKAMPAGLVDLRVLGGRGALHADILELFIGVRAAAAGRAKGDDAAEAKALARLSRARRVLKTTHKTSALAALARAGAVLATESPRAAVTVLRDALPAIDAKRRSRVGLVLAEQEVGLGLRGGERALAKDGLARAKGLTGLSGELASRRAYLLAVGPWLLAADGGKAPAKASTLAAIQTLEGLTDRLDPETPVGARYAGAAGFSLGALAVAVGDQDRAHRALQWSRRYVERPLHPFAGAVAALTGYDDAYSASAMLDDALRKARGAPLRFALHKWRALTANKRGDFDGARTHFKKMLGLAKKARVPKKVPSMTGSPLMVGDLAMMVGVKPLGTPGAVSVELTGVTFALPGFGHDFAQIRDLLKRLPKSK